MPPLPVVIVPGIMGSRLQDRRGRVVWDPDPSGGLWAGARSAWRADLRTLGRVGTRLHPTTGVAHLPASDRTVARRVPGAGGLVWGAYNRLVTSLADPSFSASCAGGVRVYASGYDWRVSTWTGSGLLASTVERALRETGAPRVVIVAHSMGGLVARMFCRLRRVGGRPGEQVTAAVVLLGSPTHGASQAYRMLRQTFVPADQLADIDLGEAFAMDTAEGIVMGRYLARYVRRFPAVYELLPTARWCRRHPHWVRWAPAATSLRDASNPDTLYADRHAGVASGFRGRASLLSLRRTFDRAIGSYLPSRSIVLFSSGIRTESRYRIDSSGRLRRTGGTAANLGDGTVPAWSAGALGMRTRGPVRRDLRTISHSGLANDPRAVREVLGAVLGVCRSSSWRGTPTSTSGRREVDDGHLLAR